MKPWWERWPGRLEYEIAELKTAGIHCERDEDAFNKGVVKLNLRHTVNGEEQNFIVVFPDVYPYIRFEIFAPDLELEHHQNPFQKNLCMIGRSTGNWRIRDTVAKYIKSRLPIVISTGMTSDPSAAKKLEEPQGEPITAYYPYLPNTIVLIDSSWSIDPSIRKGSFEIGVDESSSTGPLFAILAVKDTSGNVLVGAEPELASLYPRRLQGKWLRCPEAIRENDPNRFLAQIVAYDSSFKTPRFQKVRGGKIGITGVVFPEEVAWRQNKDGWIFIIRIEKWKIQKIKRRDVRRKHAEPYFVRAGRSGRSDLAVRIPELSNLHEKKIAVFGLGCLGAPSVLELARCGVGELRIVDFDFVEAGTTVRWPFGLKTIGKQKTDVIENFINEHYPFTKVVPWTHRIGAVAFPGRKYSDLEVLDSVLDGVDIVYDVSAELGLQYLLSDLADERCIPYLAISTTNGAWGGIVARIRPDQTEGCWKCFLQNLKDDSFPTPMFDSAGEVQPVGCADPTFTGTGFDSSVIALGGVRLAVSTLLAGRDKGYPDFDWDVATIDLRDQNGKPIAPSWKTFALKKHPSCSCSKNV